MFSGLELSQKLFRKNAFFLQVEYFPPLVKILEQDTQMICRIFQALYTDVYLCEICFRLHKLGADDQTQDIIGISNEEQQDEFSGDENLTQNQSLQKNQNDTKNLKESLNKLKAREDKMLLEIDNLKITLEPKNGNIVQENNG